MSLLFTLVTGNCDVLERAPVLLIALQRQLFWPGGVKETNSQILNGNTLFFADKREQRGRRDFRKKKVGNSEVQSRQEDENKPALFKMITKERPLDIKVYDVDFMGQTHQESPACQQSLSVLKSVQSNALKSQAETLLPERSKQPKNENMTLWF